MRDIVRNASFHHYRLKGHSDGITALAWDSSASTLLSSSFDGTAISWDPRSRTTLQRVERAGEWMTGVAVTPDGQRAAISLPNCALLWDPHSGRELGALKGHRDHLWGTAISSDGHFLATTSHDRTVRVWDINTQRQVQSLVGHTDTVLAVVLTGDGQRVISAGDDTTIRIWSLRDGENIVTLSGHTEPVRALALTKDEKQIVSASMDGTIRVWNMQTGVEIATLEGHSEAVGAISISSDGRLLASASFDDSVLLWRCDTWAQVGMLRSVCSKFPVGLAFKPNSPVLATVDRGKDILLWEIDEDAILGKQTTESPGYYTNAKVAIIGESGTGKSCLARALAGETFTPQESTHGMNVWHLGAATSCREAREITRETFLWDFAGQPDYHVVHQLFLGRTALAIVVFDATDPYDPFAGVEQWRNAFQRIAGEHCPAVLVAGRVDRGFPAISAQETEQYCRNQNFDTFIATSAKTGENIRELRTVIDELIPWNSLPVTTSPKLWRNIREFLLGLRERAGALVRLRDLREAFRVAHVGSSFTEDEFATVVGHAQAQGLVWKLSFGDILVLRPELLNTYASAVVQAARRHPMGLGSVVERDVLEARIPFDGVERMLRAEDERLLLLGVVELLLGNELAFREGNFLVFPSKHSGSQQTLSTLLQPHTKYQYRGPAESTYATLVVRLAYCGAFPLRQLCRNAAEFTDLLGHSCAVKLESKPEGPAELLVCLAEDVSVQSRMLFLNFVEHHLQQRMITGSLTRNRIYRCPTCKEEVTNDKAIAMRLARGLANIPCQYCGEAVPLTNIPEEFLGEETWLDRVQTLDRAAAKKRSRVVSEITVMAKERVGEFDVFLAYNEKDKKQVEQIGGFLKERGLNPWLDKWNVAPGQRFAEEVERVLPTTRAVAVFVAGAGAGPWEQVEIYAALQSFVKDRRPVIPVLLPGASDTHALPLFLQQFNAVRFSSDVSDEEALDKLEWGITGRQPKRGHDVGGMVAKPGSFFVNASA